MYNKINTAMMAAVSFMVPGLPVLLIMRLSRCPDVLRVAPKPDTVSSDLSNTEWSEAEL